MGFKPVTKRLFFVFIWMAQIKMLSSNSKCWVNVYFC